MRKVALFYFSLAMGIPTVLSATQSLIWPDEERQMMIIVQQIFTGVITLSAAGYLWVTGCINNSFVCVLTLTMAVATLLADFQGAPTGIRFWPFFIIIIDILLVVRAPRWMSQFLVAVVCLWLLAVETEMFVRYGLLDAPGLLAYERRRDFYQCEKPPCAHGKPGLFVIIIYVQVAVFVVDFLFTHGFAAQLQREHDIKAASVIAAQQIAASLASFNLDEAERALYEQQDQMSEDLRCSFNTLLYNLGVYRPYLPQSCFDMSFSAVDLPHCSGLQNETVISADASSQFDCRSQNGLARTSQQGSTLSLVTIRSESDNTSEPVTPRSVPVFRSESYQNMLRSNTLRIARIALLHLVGGLEVPSMATAADYVTLHSLYLSKVLDCCGALRGVTDEFHGDRIAVSFNAASRNVRAAVSAVTFLSKFAVEIASNMPQLTGHRAVVCGGNSMVGTLGTDSMRRPSILGRVPALLQAMGLYQIVSGVQYLCNTDVFQDACSEHEMRMVLDRVYADAKHTVRIYEIKVNMQSSPRDSGQEWMYELAANKNVKSAEIHNRAAKIFFTTGLAAAIAMFADEADSRAFAALADAGRTVNLAPQVTRLDMIGLPRTPLGAEKDNVKDDTAWTDDEVSITGSATARDSGRAAPERSFLDSTTRDG